MESVEVPETLVDRRDGAILSWVWLAVGALLLPFAAWRTTAAIAAWMAPLFLLRFERTCAARRPPTMHGRKPCGVRRVSLHLIWVAQVVGLLAGNRGAPFDVLGLVGNVLLKGAAWTLPYVADRCLERRLRGWARTLVFPLSYTVIDWLISLTAVTGSGSPAYSVALTPAIAQAASLTGMWGLTFLVAWFASLANALWESRFEWRRLAGQVIPFAGLMAALVVFGALRLDTDRPAASTVAAATVTVDPALTDAALRSFDWLGFPRFTDEARAALRPRLRPTVDQMVSRTETALASGARIVAWQESGAWILEEDVPALVTRVAGLTARYDAYVNVAIEELTRVRARRYVRNESLLIDAQGRVLWTYAKAHPVPYGEAFVTVAGPPRLPIVESRYGWLSTTICYDTYFPALVRQAGAGRTAILINPTNDTRPFAESALSIATLRAVENGCALLRPTGGGISAVIDWKGRVVARQSAFDDASGVMPARIPVGGVRTLYSLIGDLFAYLCAVGLLAVAALALLRRRA